jgi:hypothetical protein
MDGMDGTDGIDGVDGVDEMDMCAPAVIAVGALGVAVLWSAEPTHATARWRTGSMPQVPIPHTRPSDGGRNILIVTRSHSA